jgi:hypothetical protein
VTTVSIDFAVRWGRRFRLLPTHLALTLVFVALPLQAQRWQMQYSYDEGKSELVLQDMQFPSASNGVAIGTIEQGKSHKPVAVTTSDGGAHWSVTRLEESPISLFFLNDTVGWMVTEKGVWKTQEAGKDWKKLPKVPGSVWRVYFADENNGWAVCAKKAVLATHDGGRKWEPVAAATEPPGAPERSAYSWIGFATPKYGLITGYNQPVLRWGARFPSWMDPEDALSRRETPHLTYTLVTRDGGKTWRSGSASIIGHISRFRFAANGTGLGLMEFGDSFKYPSEVYQLDWTSGKNHTVFRDKRYAITDVWLTSEGTAYIAGIEVAGQVRSVSPGKVKVFTSTDLIKWDEMPVDYRAVAERVVFAGTDAKHFWLATDNGMILRLQ